MSAVGTAPALAALPCANPAADPCLISSTATIPVGVYDIRPMSLSVANKQITVSGAGELKILAANVTFQPGARFIATGTDGNTTVTLDATGFIDIQSQGTSKSKIDVSGNFGGGTINLHSVGNLSVNGTLIANATNLLGYGGPINIKSDTGNVTITGDPSEGVKSFGNAQGGGGSINVDATVGGITVSTQLVPKGGDCGSCEVNLNAGATITTTAQGVIDMRASGIGDGGFFSASAGGNINLAGNILANGSSDEFEGGTGGDVLVSATGSVTVGGRIELSGAGQDAAPGSETGSVDGDGGSLDISAGTTIQLNGPMFGISKGFGSGDEFSFDAGGNVTIAAEIDMTGDNFGGDVTVLSDGLITVSARVRTATPIDPVNKPSSLGGTIDLEGCQINVTATGQVIATGPGGVPSGANYFAASTGITIAGTVTATAENELRWRTTAPLVSGTVAPAGTVIVDPNLQCCGVSCPITTTSTSSTTTTTTGVPTTTRLPTTSITSTTSTSSTSSTSTSSTSSTSTSSSTSSSTSTSTSSTSTTSTSTSSTTSTTLVVGCPTAPQPACQTGAKVQILVNEKSFGKEQIKVKVDKLVPNLPLAFFGDPLAGTTGYAVCLYSATNTLVAALRVNRPHDQCGTQPCWKVVGGIGYKYGDKVLAADGVLQLLFRSGPAGTGKVIAKAKRNLAKGLTALPIGVAPNLVGNRRATVQLMTSNAGCITGTATHVSEASPALFKATSP
jgi:hypothetical protein